MKKPERKKHAPKKKVARRTSRKKASLVPPMYDDRKPSEVTDGYWLHAYRKKLGYPRATPRCGKWLVFAPMADIDSLWAKIKLATEEGRLGDSSKVATAVPNPNSTNPDSSVICVYTYDWQDEEDVRRIREELRKLGIVNKIPYKSDEDTRDGKYRVAGHTRISKYYE